MGRGGLPSACNPSFFSVAGFGDEPEAVGEANPKPPSTPASATTCLTLVIAAPCGTCAGSRIGRTRTLNDYSCARYLGSSYSGIFRVHRLASMTVDGRGQGTARCAVQPERLRANCGASAWPTLT